MAVISELGELWNTTAGNKTVTATPAVDDLVVVVAGASSMAVGDDISVSDNGAGGTYTRITRAIGGGTAGMLDIWIRNGLVSSAVSTIYTATITGDTGGGLTVLKVTGMLRTGSEAALQSKNCLLYTSPSPRD